MEATRKIDVSNVSSDYHDLPEVFIKEKAFSLLPHRPYDCVIDLLPGALLPSSQLYKRSRAKSDPMETCVMESLVAGAIWPPYSPLGAVFFLCSKEICLPMALY